MSDSSFSLVRALKGYDCDGVPLWLMRQAGRYLPEYKKTRARAGSFLDLCYTPELAAEVMLQPLERFALSGSILFSDILVVPHAMGMDVRFVEGEGPVLIPVTSKKDVEELSCDVCDRLEPVFETLRFVKPRLGNDVALIGFCGAPWTVAAYMVEGRGSRDYAKARAFSIKEREAFSLLMQRLIDVSSAYLLRQVECGAQVVQIFDSWAGVLSESEFVTWCIEPTRALVAKVKEVYPEVPIIGFPRGAGVLYERYVQETGVDAVSLDSSVPLTWARDVLQPLLAVQGNLDNVLLAADKERAVQQTEEILSVLSQGPFVFNLGHGILPHTPIEHVSAVVDVVNAWECHENRRCIA